jgi:hypothetical protein
MSVKIFIWAMAGLLLPLSLRAQQPAPARPDTARTRHWYISSNAGPIIGAVLGGTARTSQYDLQLYREPFLAKGAKGWRMRIGFGLSGEFDKARNENDTNSTTDQHGYNLTFRGMVALERIWQVQAPLKFGLGPVLGPSIQAGKTTGTSEELSTGRKYTNTATTHGPGGYLGLIGSLNWQANAWLMLGADAQFVATVSRRVQVQKNQYQDNLDYTRTQRDQALGVELQYAPLWRISATVLIR